MAQINLTLDSEVLKGLFTADGKEGAFAGLASVILNQVLSAQASEQIGAEPYERSDERQTYHNGLRNRIKRIGAGIQRELHWHIFVTRKGGDTNPQRQSFKIILGGEETRKSQVRAAEIGIYGQKMKEGGIVQALDSISKLMCRMVTM